MAHHDNVIRFTCADVESLRCAESILRILRHDATVEQEALRLGVQPRALALAVNEAYYAIAATARACSARLFNCHDLAAVG